MFNGKKVRRPPRTLWVGFATVWYSKTLCDNMYLIALLQGRCSLRRNLRSSFLSLDTTKGSQSDSLGDSEHHLRLFLFPFTNPSKYRVLSEVCRFKVNKLMTSHMCYVYISSNLLGSSLDKRWRMIDPLEPVQ